MRIGNLWETIPLSAKLKLFWDRITLTRTTTVYFVFSALHCVVQVVLQVRAFRINVRAANFLASLVEQGKDTDSDGFYVFGNDLRFCNDVPTPFSTSSCQVIWDGMVGNNTLNPPSALEGVAVNRSIGPLSVDKSRPATARDTHDNPVKTSNPTSISTIIEDAKDENLGERMFNASATFKQPSVIGTNDTIQVIVNDPGWGHESAILNRECLWTLGWPVQILRNTKREDLTFIMFQIWVLGMSVVAILNESVPHTIASLLIHLVATGWAGFQIFNTSRFRSDFTELTTNGACHPINLLPTYWRSRSAAEIPSLVLNAAALMISAFLSWRLAKAFGWQTFKRIGASLAISRVYGIVLTLSIVIQLSLFFIITSIALWLDQLWNGAIGHLATSPVYRPLLILTLILLPPWLASGWYSVRREGKIEILVFLFMCLGYLAGWGAMFDSTTFRWTYITWTFFGAMTTTSVFLTLLSFILGVVCRMNFGKGLPHHLNARSAVRDDCRWRPRELEGGFPVE